MFNSLNNEQAPAVVPLQLLNLQNVPTWTKARRVFVFVLRFVKTKIVSKLVAGQDWSEEGTKFINEFQKIEMHI